MAASFPRHHEGPGAVRRAGAAVIVGGWALTVATFVVSRSDAPFRLKQVLAWPGYLWLALALYLLLAVLAGELVRPVLRRILERRARTSQAAEPVPARPEPIPAGQGTGRGPSGPGGPGDATDAGTRGTARRRRRRVRPAGSARRPLPAAVRLPRRRRRRRGGGRGDRRLRDVRRAARAGGEAGHRAAGQASPARRTVTASRWSATSTSGRCSGGGFAQKVVDTINSTQPDLIAVVGDLVDGNVKDLGPAAAPLAQLRARHGSFFVTGNHEYFSVPSSGSRRCGGSG
ncbi:hypothetical protein GCM10023238_11990 [Streptomyces heliomycini]